MTKKRRGIDDEEAKYLDILDKSDLSEYLSLKNILSSQIYKNARNKSNENFSEMVDYIRKFVEKEKENVSNRGLVCGILWLSNGTIAINVSQLKILFGRCKSSINCSFQALGYKAIPPAFNSTIELCDIYPYLKNNFPELRQWSLRRFISQEELNDVNDLLQRVHQATARPPNFTTPPPDQADHVNYNEVEISIIEEMIPDTEDDPFFFF